MSSKYHILFIEDSQEDYLLMKRSIDMANISFESERVDTIANLEKQLNSTQWDCFLLDYDIPGHTVDEFLKILHDFDEYIPIIVVSGIIAEDQVAIALQYGARDYVMKNNLRRLPNVITREIESYNERNLHYKTQLEKIKFQEALITNNRVQEKLYQSAFDYLKMSPDDDIYEHLSTTLHNLIPNSIVTVNVYDPSRDLITVRHISGLEKFNSFLPGIMKKYVLGKEFKPTEESKEVLTRGKLTDLNGGLYTLLFEQAPESVCSFIEKQLNISTIKTMGLVSGNTVHGNVVILQLGEDLNISDQSIETFVNVATVALRRKDSEKLIKESLYEKEVMLKEIHHRVKNNLQIISSLLELQSMQIKEDETKYIFMDSQSRVKSMALVHEKIYQSEDLSSINYREYIDQLAEYLFTSYNLPHVNYSIDSEEIQLPIDAAIPAGIIINELISNSLKHAFPSGKKGTVSVELKNSGNHVKLAVMDNGIGFKKDIDLSKSKSLGLELVYALIQQLNAKVEIETKNGTKFTIMIPQNNISD